ncbi:lipoprotein [Spiroplasma phoeniceum]|uniref:Lipoprotein n=1 Tax=Spiroplasma phoeniceum P40 TaxID=1276259 RepID=A0A345DM75_9MOLU|nr:lipoprotein [Spiroplasma phoeniceum]AXF95313.1 hypothetical protein SDAV_00319 [Spiroplasma phoeniceum P40]
MKKILAILGAISFSAIGASHAIACNAMHENEIKSLQNQLSTLKGKINNLKNISEKEKEQLKFALIELENQLQTLTSHGIKSMSKTELDLLKTAISFLEEQFNKLS